MSAAKRPITAEDLERIQNAQTPRISPCGKYVAFVRVSPDALEKTYRRNIWLHLVADGETRQLTRGGKDSQPTWSPDGKRLAFVSARGGKPQLYLLPVAAPGGEARQLTELEHGCHSPDWSPDGSRIAFLSPLSGDERAAADNGEENASEPADKLESKHRKERQAEREAQRWDPRPMWRIPYRQGTDFVDERYDQVWVVDTDETDETESKPRRLTGLNAAYSQPRWSADGQSILSSRTTQPEGDEPWRAQNVFRLDLESGQETALGDGEYSLYAPKPSPDGKWIACERSPIGITDKPARLLLISVDGQESRLINDELDREVFDWAWSPQSQLALSIESEGRLLPWIYDAAADRLSQAHSGCYEIDGIDIGPGGLMAMTVSTPRNPHELYLLDQGELRQATSFNQAWLDEVITQPVHELRFKSQHGAVQGWYMLPVGYKAGDKAPLALNIHGGPHAAWGFATQSMWHEWQFHAARGYAVFYCNPHGSGGYGEAFMHKLHGAWGPVAMDDIMAGLEALLALGYVDERRMAITGGSYGGYMTAWIIGHSQRFRAAVAQRGVYNLNSFYGTSDVPLLISNEFDAEPWEDHEVYWDNSPLKYASAITTPLLLIHAEHDYRVPIEQAEQLFAWLRRATNTPVSMLRYPREGHELSRSGEPGHRVSRLSEMVDWFDRYTGGDSVLDRETLREDAEV